MNTGYKNEASIFTKVDYSFNFITLFADIQFRYSSFDYKGNIPFGKLHWNFFNPKLGLSFEVKPNSILYYSIGSTSREPTRNDIFGGNDNLISDSLGNSILKIKTPEYVFNQEFGFRYQSTKLNLNFNLYYMDFKNEIVFDGKFGPNGLALTNKVEQSFRSGVELSITYKISSNFSIINNSSFNYSRIKEQKEVFSPILTPPIIINQEVVYSFKGLTFALSTRYQDKSYINFSNTSIVKSYIVFNGRFTYNFSDYDFSVFLNNITNSQYFNNGYEDFDGIKKYFVQAPTNVYVSINYRL